MSAIFKKEFWLDAAERAIKSAAQAPLGLWVLGDIATDWTEVDWKAAGFAALSGAIISLLTSIASSSVSNTITPASLIKRD